MHYFFRYEKDIVASDEFDVTVLLLQIDSIKKR